MKYIGFERALNFLKDGLSMGRAGWKPAKVIRLKKGKYEIPPDGQKPVLLGLGLGMNKYYEPSPELNQYPKFVMNKEDGSEIEVRLGIEDYLSEDWYIGEKDMHFDCIDKVEEYPDYVCITNDDFNKVKRGSILRFDKDRTLSFDSYYHYVSSTDNKRYISFDDIKKMDICYQELRKTNCEVVDEWHVRFTDISKEEKPYRVEKLSEEELKKAYDVNNNIDPINIKDCEKNLTIDKDVKWHEFEIRVDGDIKEIKFENGVLITIRMSKKIKPEKCFIPKKYIGIISPGVKTKGNLNDIWVEQTDGNYRCDIKPFSITKEQLESDVKNGFLVKIKEEI